MCPFEDLVFCGGSDGKESTCNEGDPVRFLVWEDPLEKGMATHSSILAWRIPWTEESGRTVVYGVTKSWTRLSSYTFEGLRSYNDNS